MRWASTRSRSTASTGVELWNWKPPPTSLGRSSGRCVAGRDRHRAPYSRWSAQSSIVTAHRS